MNILIFFYLFLEFTDSKTLECAEEGFFYTPTATELLLILLLFFDYFELT